MKPLLRLLLLLLVSNIANAQQFNPLLADKLQDTLDYFLANVTNIKGYSASVYLPGQGMWKGAGGMSYTGTPITSDMKFGIASNSKLYVSTIMLLLQENNVLNLDDPISQYLPVYPNVNPNITIRQLLNHTSGVSDPFFVSPWMDTINNNATRVFTPEEVMTWVGLPLFTVGTSWGYSNVNYVLAGMIAESTTGYHISQLIRDSILTPLNMDSTYYDVEETSLPTVAHRWWNTIDYSDTSTVGLNTAGGCAGALFSTSGEMAQWYDALFSGQIINAQSLNELSSFVSTTSGIYDYGLGLSRETTLGRTYWGHGGSTWGYKSKMIYDTCMHAVVCGLANSFPAGMDGITFLLYRTLLHNLPGCSADISGAVTVCQEQNSVTYMVSPIEHASSYEWTLLAGATGTSSTNSITVDYGSSAVSGNITVKGVNAYGYSPAFMLLVSVNSVETGVVLNNLTITADVTADAYQWLDCSNAYTPINGATAQSYTATVNGNYAVLITEGLCSDTSACVQVITVGLQTEDPDKFNIFPNPSDGEFTLLLDENSVVEIHTVSGCLVYSNRFNKGRHQLALSLADGIYFIKQKHETSCKVEKLVIE